MKHKNRILFIIITFLRSIFVAALKFFLRSYLKEAHISLEQIAGYIGLWWIIAYLIWSSCAYAFRKKHITIAAWIITIICLIIGRLCGYYPLWTFILLVSGIGFAYSLRLVVKSIILSIEIQQSDRWEAKINGIINISILLGILLWSYMWFAIFGKRGSDWFLVIVALLVISSILTIMMNYDTHFQAKSFSMTLRQSLPNMRGIMKKYIRLLLPIGVLRAISTAIGQKMLEIGVDLFARTPTSSIIVVVISFIGAIIGFILSTLFIRKRKTIAIIFTIIFWLSTIYFPHIIDKYEYFITLNIFWFAIGIFFGIAVNLLEWRYFFHIGDDHRKEYGSVAYGIATSCIVFLIMIATDYLTKKLGIKITFFAFGLILLVMPFLIRKFDASDLSPKIEKKNG